MSVSRKLSKGIRNVRRLSQHRDWENYRDLVIVLFQKELKVRYKHKVLGYLWSVASPLAFAMVYYVAFQLIMRIQIPNYPLILISGIFPWQWFTNAIGAAPNLFIGNASIIKKVNFPRDIIPLATGFNHMFHYVVSLPIILLFLLHYQKFPNHTWLYGVPILLILQTATVHGMVLILSSINLIFRDLERLTRIILDFAFYFTPILYPIESIPPRFQILVPLNPLAPLIIGWRELILENRLDTHYLFLSTLYAILFLFLGYVVYRKLRWKFAEVI